MKTILALLALALAAQAQTAILGSRQFYGNVDLLNSSAATVAVSNAGSTGTTLNKLAKLTGAPSTAVVTATTDTNGAIGIVTTGAGTTGSALIARFGIVGCVFDGATTANDYVQISSTTAGDCHDAGSSLPSSGQVVGAVLSTNGSGGTYNLMLWPEGVVNTRRTCLIENDTQSATALTAAQMSGKCTIPAAATIVEVDVSGGTQVLTGSATAPTYTGTSSIQIGKHGASNSTGLLSAVLATVSGVACALTSTSGTCLFNNAMTSSSTVTISTTALAAGDQIYVSAATADAAQTWYHVAVIYVIN
jgi:hypothetical protein